MSSVVAYRSAGAATAAAGRSTRRFGRLSRGLLVAAVLALAAGPALAQQLDFIGVQRDGVQQGGSGGFVAPYVPQSVVLSPDGSQLYVAGSGGDAVSVFTREPATGLLTLVETERNGVGGVDGLDGARALAMAPGGSHLYVASFAPDFTSTESSIAVFARDATTGALTFVQVLRDGEGGVEGVGGASSVVVSSDGSHVYVAGNEDDSIAIFSRNQTTGALTFDSAVVNGVGAIAGLNGVTSLAITPDGSNLYAASSNVEFTPGDVENALVVFSRNPASGALLFVEAERDGQNGVDGLAGASSVAVTSDNLHVYVTGPNDNAVAVFARDPASLGAVTFIEAEVDGVAGVNGMGGARAVMPGPDGSLVYVVASQNGFGLPANNSVVVYSRDAASGALTFVEAERNGIFGVEGLIGASALAVSNDNVHVYAAGSGEDAVAIFGQAVPPAQTSIVAAVLPTSRSVQIGQTATAFATIINSGSDTAFTCGVAPPSGVTALFGFQTTDPATNALTGSANTPVMIGAGASQSFVFSFRPTARIDPVQLAMQFTCSNSDPVTSIVGVNTFLFSASEDPVPDVIALAATIGAIPGVVDIPDVSGLGAFAVASANVGSADTVTATPSGNAGLPVTLSICQTNPADGSCLAPPAPTVTTAIAAGATPTFSIFVAGTGTAIALDPALNRIFVNFLDTGGAVRGGTSVAVRTL